jgi:hypothetical protein
MLWLTLVCRSFESEAPRIRLDHEPFNGAGQSSDNSSILLAIFPLHNAFAFDANSSRYVRAHRCERSSLIDFQSSAKTSKMEYRRPRGVSSRHHDGTMNKFLCCFSVSEPMGLVAERGRSGTTARVVCFTVIIVSNPFMLYLGHVYVQMMD